MSSGQNAATISSNFVFNGTTWDRQRGSAADGTLVNLGANNDVTITEASITPKSGTATASGTTVLHTPAGGKVCHKTVDCVDNDVPKRF